MAVPKQVKVGGSYYKGSILNVASASGDYVVFLTLTGTGGCAVNSISITPEAAGPGDTMKLEHMSGATGGNVVATLAESLPNMGAGIPINLDFFAMEKVLTGESLKLTYSNTALTSMQVFIILERGR